MVGHIKAVWRLFIDEASERAFADQLTMGTASLSGLCLSSAIVSVPPTSEQLKLLHGTIRAVTEDFEALEFNTAVSRLMEFVNEAIRWEQKPRAIMEPFLLLLAPLAPHLCEELWEKLGHGRTLAYEPWPVLQEKLLREDRVTVIFQVNGKVRDRVEVATGLGQAELEKLALVNEKVKAFLTGKQIKKVIVVPDKLVNIVVG